MIQTSFFEMLGNFPGNYFRNSHTPSLLITKEFSLPENRLLVTGYTDNE